MATKFNLVYPQRATMWTDEATVVAGNALLRTNNSSAPYNRINYQNGPANGDSWTHSFVIAAGVATVDILYVKATSYGIVDVYVDNVLASAGNDTYNGTTTYNNHITFPWTFSAGYHVLKTVVNGHNALTVSPHYFWVSTKIDIKPAAD